MQSIKMWHLMFVGGILAGLLTGTYEALAYVNHPAAFVLGLFLGGFVSWGIVSAMVILFGADFHRTSVSTATKVKRDATPFSASGSALEAKKFAG